MSERQDLKVTISPDGLSYEVGWYETDFVPLPDNGRIDMDIVAKCLGIPRDLLPPQRRRADGE